MTEKQPELLGALNYLETQFTGHKFIYHPVTESTNSDLKILAAGDAPNGTVVVADMQTEGRGRLDHKWLSSDEKNLCFSVLFYPDRSVQEFPQMALITAVALVRALKECFPEL